MDDTYILSPPFSATCIGVDRISSTATRIALIKLASLPKLNTRISTSDLISDMVWFFLVSSIWSKCLSNIFLGPLKNYFLLISDDNKFINKKPSPNDFPVLYTASIE